MRFSCELLDNNQYKVLDCGPKVALSIKDEVRIFRGQINIDFKVKEDNK